MNANILTGILNTLVGGIGTALTQINNLIKSGLNMTMQFHQEGIEFARGLGMNIKEAQAYTEVLTERTERLAMKYGVTVSQVKELQKNISVATTRQLMLNESQAEGFLQLNKLVGSSTVSKFAEEMMNGMGGQIDTVQGAVAKAYATAAKSGLNAQKVSEKIANNLGMANRLSFRTGIDGLTRMAMKAEKIGMNLQSVEAAAGKFMEIDQAIENSARLQMLGGNAAIMGGNPLDMAYEANYDPEAFQDRMSKMLGGYAQFDAQKGISSINGINMDFVRNIAQAMGISTEEASKIAKKNAEVKFKESNINFGAYGNLTQEQKDFLINKSNVANGRTTFTTSSGEKVDLTSGQAIDPKVLEEMMKYEGMSDHEIMAQNAESLTSINEKLEGLGANLAAQFAEYFDKYLPQLTNLINKASDWLSKLAGPIATFVGENLKTVGSFITENKDTIKTVAKYVGDVAMGIAKFMAEWPKTSLAIIAAIWGASKLGLVGGATKFAARAATSTSTLAKVGSGAIGAGIGLYKAFTADNKEDRGEGIGTAVGSIAGAFFGPIGATIGGWLGGAVGKMVAKHWDGVTRLAKGVWDSIKKMGSDVWNGIKTIGISFWEGIKEFGMGIFNALYDIIVKPFKDIFEMFQGIGQGVAQIFSGEGILKGFETIASSIGNGIFQLISNPFRAVGDYAKGVINGVGTFAKGIWDGIGRIGSGIWNGIKEIGLKVWYGIAKVLNYVPGIDIDIPKGYANGGIVGTKDNVVGIANGEIVLDKTMQENLVSILKNPPVQAREVGGPQYVYKPNGSETSNVNGNTITVKDFNININGTLKLDGGTSSRNLDIRELLNDRDFVNALKDVVKTAINNDVNGGRHMNDLAVMGGYPAQTNIYGK